jgi:hypothetical protein
MSKLILTLLLLSNCYLKHYPLTPDIVRLATYKLSTPDYMGTAWAVDKHHLVTAGHMCEVEGPFKVMRNYRYLPVTPIVWEYGTGVADLCVLYTPRDLDSWLIVAEKMPAVGDSTSYVGYPNGEYTESTGVYLGDLDGSEEHWNDAVFTAPCDHGASGSPVYTRNGVWGVLVRIRTDGGNVHPGSEGCVAISLDYLKSILDNAGVKYVTPPELPKDP